MLPGSQKEPSTRHAGGDIGGANVERCWENLALLILLFPRNIDRKHKGTQAVPPLIVSFRHYAEGMKGV